MKSFTSLFICILLLQYSYAQDYKQYLHLSYQEIDSLLYLQYYKGAFDKAIPFMEAGREKANNQFGNQDTIFSEYCDWGVFLYTGTGQYDKALPLSIQSKNITEKVRGKEHRSYANSLIRLATLHRSMGNYDKALLPLIESKNIMGKVLGKEHPDFATSLIGLAYLHQSMGNYDKALPLYIQSKNIREKVLGKEDPEFARSLRVLGQLYQDMGDYDKALPLFIQAKSILEKTLGKEHRSFGGSLDDLAGLYKDMENYDKALPLYIQAKNITGKVLGKEHPEFASSLNNLAVCYKKMKNHDKALPLFTQVLVLRERILGNEHPNVASSLNSLAVSYKDMGDYEKALPLFIQALVLREKVLGKEHPNVAYSLNGLAVLHTDMGNFDKALPLFIQAIQAMSLINISHNINTYWADSLLDAQYPSNLHLEKMITSLEGIYQLLEKDKTSSKEKQKVVAQLASQLLQKLRQQLSNEKDKLRILKSSAVWLNRSLDVLNPPEHSSIAFQLADQNKSVLLLKATKSEQTYKIGYLPDSLISKDKNMLKKQSQLQAKLVEKRSKQEKDSLRKELIHINQNIDDFLLLIKKRYPPYYKLKYQEIDTKVEEIQALLDDNTALLEYVITDSTLHIFLVDNAQVQWTKSFLSNKELKNRIKTLHHALSDYKMVTKDKEKAYREYTEQAHWFYLNLIAPALANKTNIQNLILVTHGELGHLPFETFLVEPAPQEVTDYHELHYLVNDYNISYNYSATLWKENKEAPAPSNNGQILGIAANYNLQLDSSMMELRLPTDQWMRDALNPLPAARKEVEILKEKYQGFFAFDTLASEKTVKEKASDFAILHFATHGILDAKRPILSSLAFSEDNDSTESNFWQAHEISKIQLNADLVVLSACETGYGEFEAGNGIASLARAFMYAGASSLIVSLWQVNDYATSEVMKHLYDNLANGMKKDEALRQAKIQYIKSAKGVLAHPAFWSPFIMMGKTDAIAIKTKGGGVPWLVVGGVVLLVLGGGFVVSRRKKERA